ncbi:MAG: sulfatase-like hydrolase/transferase [bacterium]
MKPNILVIMTDQHNKKMLGCYGNSIVRTPNLDNLAEEGTQFTNAYCPAPLCVPSRMSFMTSRKPSSIAVYNNSHILHSGIPTWAHHLSSAGYETALIGRMHFNGPDKYHGFERRLAGELKSESNKVPSISVTQWREAAEIVGRGPSGHIWFDAMVKDKVCEFLLSRSKNSIDEPFAAVAGFLLPHTPFIAPKELYDYYYDRIDVPEFDEKMLPATIRKHRKIHRFSEKELSVEQIRRARAAYFGMCETVDGNVGEILETLDKTGLSKNTLVIYTTDHGDMAGEKGLWFKNSYYEGSAGVPLLMRMPDSVKSNAKSDIICNLMDLGPTFCDLAGASPIIRSDGRSMLNIMRGDKDGNRPDETFSEVVNDRMHPGLPTRMIRSGKWKLWVFGGQEKLPPAMFNLEEDPQEMNDLGQNPDFSEIRNKLLDKVYSEWNPDNISVKEQKATADSEMVYKTANLWENEEFQNMPPDNTDDELEMFPYDVWTLSLKDIRFLRR